jgi:hypothetical protein
VVYLQPKKPELHERIPSHEFTRPLSLSSALSVLEVGSQPSSRAISRLEVIGERRRLLGNSVEVSFARQERKRLHVTNIRSIMPDE